MLEKEYTVWGVNGQTVRRGGGLLLHYVGSLMTQDSLWHGFQSLTDRDFNPHFATPKLRDFGHIISAQCLALQ